MKTLIPAVALLICLASPAASQDGHEGHGAANQAVPAEETEATRQYKEAMDTMHSAMAAQQYSGNADVDFARGMIPHHRAAVEMAQTVLAHGKDPEIRKLAEEIVAAQEREIKQLEDWLAKNGGPQ